MQKKINTFLKRNILGTQNLIKYFLFNKLFKASFTNKNSSFKGLSEKGFIKLDRIDEKIINKINQEIKNQNIPKNEKSFNFKINNKLKVILREMVGVNLKKILDDLKKVYNFDLIISNIEIKRNFFFEKKNHEFENIFSENYHQDKYVCTQIKQLIYLSEVKKDCGPFSFFNIENSRDFVKKNKLEDRFAYKIDNKTNNIGFNENFFLGKPGETLIVDTSEVIHRATIPSNHRCRDMLTITYNLINDKNYKNIWSFVDKNNNFWEEKNLYNYSKKFSKPTNYRNLIETFIRFLLVKFKFINS